MIKRSPSRNHRSKGIKVKHVLQIILLLGICFWLIYQVKHSHDKKNEFDENDAKLTARTQTVYQIPKLGRKDLHPDKDQVNQDEKHEEENEDDNIVEDEDKNEHSELDEGNRHESEEKEDEEHEMRGEEQEEDEKGGGDDEIDENDQEQSAVDTDHDEEFMDEEKEKEEESDEKESKNKDEEKDGSVKNHNIHEAREEQYKGDDASSAVTHDTHTTSTETEIVSLENSDVNSEMTITKSENRPNYTEKSNRNEHSSNFNITEVELAGGTSSNATSGKETGSNSLSDTVDGSHQDNISNTYSDSRTELSSNGTVVIPVGVNNMTGASANTSSEQNKIAIFSESDQAQNGTVNSTVTGYVKNVQTKGLEQGDNRVSEENLPASNSAFPVKPETGDAAAGKSSNLEGGELKKNTKFVASNETENNGNTETNETNKTQNNSYMKENTNATKDEFNGDTKTDETSDSTSAKGTSDSVEHHDTDSHILKDVTEVRTDLDSLPVIKNEVDNGDATATD